MFVGVCVRASLCDVVGFFFDPVFRLCVFLQRQCSENQFGREMYKLCIFNFLATFCDAFLLNYPRKCVCSGSAFSFCLSQRCDLNGKINVCHLFLEQIPQQSGKILSYSTFSGFMSFISFLCLAGWCRRSTLHPCWPSCWENSVS